MKKLLLSLTLMFGSFASFAQLTCATATPITEDGTISVPDITGTYQALCWGSAATGPNAIWYSFTATANGEVTINADLPQNDGTTFSNDQRVSIATGTCAALVCYGGQDDIDDANYNVNYTFPVASGTTYYIVWDDRWLATGFDFDFTFDSAVSCIRPSDLSVTAPTSITNNSANISWGDAIGSPASYDVEFGDFGFVQGAGTTVNTLTTSTPISGVANTNSDYYLRANCGSTQSAWVGPFSLFLAVNLPYANNFDGTAPQTNADGFTGSWGLGNAAGGAQSGAVYYFSGSSTTAATNAFLFTRALNLQANEQVTLTFYTRLGSATGTNQNLKVWVNGTPSAVGATQLGTDITITGATYTLQTRTFTATTAGTYYFIFHNATPIVAAATSLRLDTVNMTSVLGTNDFLSSNFSVFPNPAKNVINFSNDTNAVVSLVEMTDLNGRVIKSQKVNATEGQISISDLATGMYMMKITTDQGVATKKIVKQ